MKKNKYKVTRKDIENSPINYSFTEVAIKNMANRHSAYNINKLQEENKQLKEQLVIRDKMIEIASENFIYYENEKEHKKELKRQFAFWEKLAKESIDGTTKRIK